MELPDGILSGYRVLDLSRELGYLCGKIFGDLGAEVIKIEPPGGDPSRLTPPFLKDDPHPEKSIYWISFNVNKKSLTLDITKDEGRDILLNLIRRSDFLIETFPAGYLEELELDWNHLREINPKLIMISITPFGRKGPKSQYKASDLGIMAASGFMSLLGDVDRPPVRVTLPQSYMWASTYGALGGLFALYGRNKTGKGQHVDVPAQAATVWACAHAPFFWTAERTIPKRSGIMLTGRSYEGASYPAIFKCKDGYIGFTLYWGRAGAITHREIVKWMDERGMAPQHLKEKDWDNFDPFYASKEEINEILQPVAEFLKTVTKKEFLYEAVKRRIMGYPVSTAEDVLTDPHLQARNFWQITPYMGEKLVYPGGFARFSETFCGVRKRAPRIGEHNYEILRELGFSKSDVEKMKENGVI